jgi:glucose/arabinose dehydrogenase
MRQAQMIIRTGLAAAVTLGVAHAAEAAGTIQVADGFNQPLYVTYAPGQPDQLYVVQQSGQIRIHDLNTGTTLAQPFLDVSGSISTGGERGLLGLTFHPDYQTNGTFFVNYTDDTGSDTRIRRYQVTGDPNLADAGSGMDVLTIDQPQGNHNGGWLAFGPDGYLYASIGDGGGGNDNNAGHTPGIGNAQDITDNLLGKILRIDVDGDDFPADADRNYAIPNTNPFVGQTGDDEIWAYGLRNAWRPSFDRQTGDLYIADVGQNAREELNVQPADSDGGENYGWRLREGTIATPTGGVGGPRPADAIDPFYDYTHGGGDFEGSSVTGGYVYRGPVAELQGMYLFGDFVNDRIWAIQWDGSDPSTFDGTNYTNLVDLTDDFVPDIGSIDQLVSFGEDAAGNVYLVDRTGEIYLIVPEPATAVLLGMAAVLLIRHRWHGGCSRDDRRR